MAHSLARSSFSLLSPEVIGATANRLQTKVFNGEFGSTLFKFGSLTTAHGIPRACTAEQRRGRIFWFLITVFCTMSFAYQFTFLYSKYTQKEKIVSVELVFDTAPYPAITICNLNPFKKHLAQTVPEISNTLDAFHQAVSYSKDAQSFLSER
uniref:Uncharacterized protein n=1 Tax=Plectus sambesii TaxID=2011161 RepID=A0A914X0F8_9BILA